MQSYKDKWIDSQMEKYKGIRKEVIDFIADIRYKSEDGNNIRAIVDLFRAGYCYYFAVMLQVAFGRGTICYSYDNGHVVWVDDDHNLFEMRTAYDINGTYTDYDKDCLIPIDVFQEGVIDFMRVPNLKFGANREWIDERALLWLNNPKYMERYSNHDQIKEIKKYVERWKSAIGMPYHSVSTPPIWLAEKYMVDFTGEYLKEYPAANRYILQFIEDMIFKSGKDGVPYILTMFCNGYCYYFAKILKEAFPDGTIWISPSDSHIVFVDGDNPLNSFCYDARGVVKDIKAGELCPIEIFGELIINYMHLPYVMPESHGIEINDVAGNWRKERSSRFAELLKNAEGNHLNSDGNMKIFNHEFVKRSDGLYECVWMCEIKEEDWGCSDYYGMGLAWRRLYGKEVPWLLCPNHNLIDVFNNVVHKDPYYCRQSWTLDSDPSTSLGLGIWFKEDDN